MNASYYAMKRRLGGEKMTVRDKLCWKYYPTPGCNGHKAVVGERRGSILFKKYCFSGSRNYKLHNKANLIYWRTHRSEWEKFCELEEIECTIL